LGAPFFLTQFVLKKKVPEINSQIFTHFLLLKIFSFFVWGGGGIGFASHRLLLHLKCAFKPHKKKKCRRQSSIAVFLFIIQGTKNLISSIVDTKFSAHECSP